MSWELVGRPMRVDTRILTIVGRIIAIVSLACFIASVSIYYLPDLSRVPQPETGHIFPVRNHHTILYLTKGELWAKRMFATAGIALWVPILFILRRLGMLKWRA